MIKTTQKAICLALLFISLGLRAQMSGSYSIPGTFSTIAAAISSLNAVGVSAAVIINIAPGYTETVTAGGYTLNAITGASSSNPITFQKSGTGSNPLLVAYTGGTATPSDDMQDGVWSFVGTDYVTINGIDIMDPNTTNPSTMEFGYGFFKASATDGCQNNTIKNCVITLNRINNDPGSYPFADGSRGIDVVNALTSTQTTSVSVSSNAGANSGNKFYSNTIQNCNVGIAITGFADSSPYTNADTGNDVGGGSSATGNTIINYGGGDINSPAVGILTYAQYAFNVGYNLVNNNNGAGVNHVQQLVGIYVDSAEGASSTITNNTVTVNSGDTSDDLAAIVNVAGDAGTGNIISITNNLVTSCTYTGASFADFYGILSSAAAATVNINGNTLSNNSNNQMDGVFYIYNYGDAGTLNMNNNTLSNNSTNSSGFDAYYNIYNDGYVSDVININNNNIGLGTFNATSTSMELAGVYNDNGNSTAVLSVNNNTLQSASFAGSGGNETVRMIYNNTELAATNMNGNIFNNITLNTSGDIYLMYNSNDTPNNTVLNNVITNGFTTIGGGGTFKGYFNAGSPGTGTATVSGNNFSNVSLAGNSSFYGIDHETLNSQAFLYSNNIISNITCQEEIYGIWFSYGDAGSSITSNTVTGLYGGSDIYGMYIGEYSPPTDLTIASNVVSTFSTSGDNSEVDGIYHLDAGNTVILKNKISNFSGSGTQNFIEGIYATSYSNGSIAIYNNLIGDLRAPATSEDLAIIGLEIGYDPTSVDVAYNSIYLAATNTTTDFGSAAIYISDNPDVTLRNTILVNNSDAHGSGIATAYMRSSNDLTNYDSNSNNNLFYAGTPGLQHALYYDGSTPVLSLPALQTLFVNTDAASVTENPPFLSTNGTAVNFLSISPTIGTQVESGATPVAGITDDFYGTARNATTPDIGAIESTYTPFATCSGTPVANAATAAYTVVCPTSLNSLVLPVTSTVTGISYQWQVSVIGAGGPYLSVSGATTSVADIATGLVSSWYQAVITCSAGGSSTSTPVQINVGTGVTAPVAVADVTMVCPGNNSNIELNNAVAPGIAYQWQVSTAGATGPYTDISGEVYSSTSPSGITADSWYQAVISCSAAPSVSIASSAANVIMGIPYDVPVTSPSLSLVCANQTVTLDFGGANFGGDVVFQWQSASTASSGPYAAVSSATDDAVSVTNITSNTWYQSVISCASGPSYSFVSVPALISPIQSVTYTSVPFLENFDDNWENRCDQDNVPHAAYWTSNPTTGNNSWRRQDDGFTANWSNSGTNLVTPLAGAGAADFHSRRATNGSTGSLNLYLNMTAAAPNYSVSFYYRNTGGTDSLQVLLSTNGGSSFTKVGGYKTTSGWSKKIIDLGPVNSSSCVISFSATADHVNSQDMGIDSLEVMTCPNVVVASTSSAVCAGSSTSLSVTGDAAAYYWNGATAATGTAIVATPTANTIYSVLASNGLCAVSKTLTVNFNPAPTLNIGGSSGICTGQTASLTASGSAATYSWNTGATTPSITDTPTAATVYTVVATSAAGCKSTLTQSVSVAAALPISIIGPSVICNGDAATLTGNGGVTYTWSTTNVSTSVAITPTTLTTYTVIGASGTCSNTAVKTVSVNPKPTVAITGNTTICAGQTTTLTGNGANTYSWSTSSTNSTVPVSPTGTTTYTVTGTNTVNCSASSMITVVTNSLPVIGVVASSASVCANSSATLTASGAATYSWTGGPTSSTNAVTPSANTVYTVSATNAANCVSSQTFTLTAFALPSIVISPASATICSTSTLNLSATGANTYVWSGGPSTNSYVVNPSNATTYTVTGTSSQGCVSTNTVGVTTNTLPVTAATSATSTVCSQSPVNLTASGANTYLWSNNSTNTVVTVFPLSSSVYTVTGFSSQGCTSTGTVAISTLPLPSVIVSPALSTVCINAPATFTASGAITYTWNSTAATGSTAVFTSTASVSSYNIIGTDANGCSGNGTFIVFTNPLPVINVSSSTPTVCSLSAVTFTASGADSYGWNNSQSGGVITVNPANATTYTVTGTNTITGCSSTQTIAVSTLSLPVVAISPASPTVCAHSTLTLSASGANTYLWNTGSINNPISVTPTANISYSITGTNAAGCTNTQTVDVTVNALPTIAASSQTVCVDDVATFAPSGASTYTMMPGNLTTYTASQSISGIYNYTITGTDNNNCVNKVTSVLDVEICTGIKNNTYSGNMVSVYPNPSTGVFTARFNFAGEKTVMILNSVGQLVHEKTTSDSSEVFDLSPLAKGVYFVKVSSKEASGNYKIIIE